MVQGAQDCRTPSLGQNLWATAFPPTGFSLSPEHCKLLEQNIQKLLTQYRGDLPRRIPEALELTQLPCDVAHMCQAKDKPSPSECCSMCTAGCSKDGQEVDFQEDKDRDRNASRGLDEVPKDLLPRSSESASVNFAGVISAQSERNVMNPTEKGAGNDSHLAGVLRVHLGVKARQIQEGLIPLSLRHSWLSVHAAFPNTWTPEMSSSAVR